MTVYAQCADAGNLPYPCINRSVHPVENFPWIFRSQGWNCGIISPFLGKGASSSFSQHGRLNRVESVGMEENVSFSCPKCGTLIEAPTEMVGAETICPSCSQSMIVPATPDQAGQSLSLASEMIDLSNDRAASLNRWLNAIRVVLLCGFGFAALGVLDVSFSLVTLIAAFICLFAAHLLYCGIGQGALWARVSTYLLAILYAIVAVVVWQESGFPDCAGLGLALLVLAAAMLLLPNVSSKLKELGRGLENTKKSCLSFWAVLIFSTVLFGIAPETKGLRDYQNEIPRGLFLIVAFIISYVCEFLARCFGRGLDHAMGVGDSPVVYTKSRDVSCPKCGQLINVPNTDDNDLVACPSCQHEFYPFGLSLLAILAFYLGLFSPLVLPAPFAFACGMFALKDIKAHRGKHGITRAWFGVILGGVFCFPLSVPIGIYLYYRKKKKKINRLETI